MSLVAVVKGKRGVKPVFRAMELIPFKKASIAFLYLLLRLPNEPVFWYGFAKMSLYESNLDSARWAIERALSLDSSDSDYWVTKCEIEISSMELMRAIQTATEALTRFEDNPGLLHMRGHALVGLFKVEEALQDLERSYELSDEKSPLLIKNYVTSLLKKEKYDEAIEILTNEKNQNPNDIQVCVLLGTAFTMSGKHEDAIKEFEDILSRSSLPAGFEGHYGVSLFEIGRKEEGVEMFRLHVERIAANPLIPIKTKNDLLRQLGNYYLILGKLVLAEECFRRISH